MSQTSPDIRLFNETDREIPLTVDMIRKISSLIAHKEQCMFRFLEVIYVGESEIIRLNQEHLNRNYVTDIITFRYDEVPSNNKIEATIFCCAPRIYEQALEFNQAPEKEFRRILIHGLLHLAGYEDKTKETRKKMTQREDFYLDLLVKNPTNTDL